MQHKEPLGSLTSDLSGFLAPFGVSIDPELLVTALTHRSWAAEHGDAPNNERLEFLGDSVLGVTITAKLFRDFAHLDEGELSKRRAAIVSTTALAGIARTINLGPSIKLGKGERRSGGRDKDSILADTLEAVIGAAYLSAGPDSVESFIHAVTEPLFADLDGLIVFFDPKTTLNEEAHARSLPLPIYEHENEGPQHDRVYTARVTLDGITGQGSGTNKKAAEILAAREVVDRLRAESKLLTVAVQPASSHDA